MPTTKTPPSMAGATVSIGAGLGATVGVLVAGGPAIAIGAGVGAAIGVLVGAAWDAFHAPH